MSQHCLRLCGDNVDKHDFQGETGGKRGVEDDLVFRRQMFPDFVLVSLNIATQKLRDFEQPRKIRFDEKIGHEQSFLIR